MFDNRDRGRGCGGCIGDFIALIIVLFAALILFGEHARHEGVGPSSIHTVDTPAK